MSHRPSPKRLKRRAERAFTHGPEREVVYCFKDGEVIFEHLTCGHDIESVGISQRKTAWTLPMRRRCGQCLRVRVVVASQGTSPGLPVEN